MEERYSKIVVGSHKTHIFDHDKNIVLCGLDRWKNTPFRIYKTKFNAKDMFDDREAIAERRHINPYKWLCLKCSASIERVSKKDKILC